MILSPLFRCLHQWFLITYVYHLIIMHNHYHYHSNNYFQYLYVISSYQFLRVLKLHLRNRMIVFFQTPALKVVIILHFLNLFFTIYQCQDLMQSNWSNLSWEQKAYVTCQWFNYRVKMLLRSWYSHLTRLVCTWNPFHFPNCYQIIDPTFLF